jgi:uncharacterized RDD family membrane protein YckC
MKERIEQVLYAGLLVILTVLGCFFLVSIIFLVGFGEWVNFPFFIACVLIFFPLGVLMYKYRKNREG